MADLNYRSKPKVSPSSKECCDCKLHKLASEFGVNRSRADGLHAYCKGCAKVRRKKWALSVRPVPESRICVGCKVTLPASSFYKSLSGLSSRCVECQSAWYRNDNARHPEKSTIRSRNKRARLRNADCRHWNPDLFDSVHEQLEGRRRKLERVTGIKWHLDHIVPIYGVDAETGEHTVCGLHVWYNWQLLPALDNLVKSNKILGEAYERIAT